MVFAIAAFVLSLLGIVTLFALKAWELRTARVIAPTVREKADERATMVKRFLMRGEAQLKKLPPALLLVSRTILHDVALGAAQLARFSERQLHRLADRISYKHNFERRETNSAFLKNVSEYKNGNNSEVDTGGETGQNT